MCPTVDDLIISVRIDPTSELANLQKQLTKLVGKDGTKEPEIEIPATLKADIDFIKGRLFRISEPIIKGNMLSLQERALQQLNIITKSPEAFQEALKATDEQINSILFFMNRIADAEEKDLRKSTSFLGIMQNIITKIEEGIGVGATQLTDALKAIPERLLQDIIERSLKEFGIDFIPFIRLIPQFDINRKKDLEDALDKFIEDEDLKDSINDLRTKLGEDFNSLFEKTPFKTFIDLVGKTDPSLLSPNLFSQESLRESKLLKSLIAIWMKKFAEGSSKFLEMGILDFMKDVLPPELAKAIKRGTTASDIIPDLIVFTKQTEKISEILPELGEQLKEIKDQSEFAIVDLKTTIGRGKSFINQLNEFKELVGEGLAIFLGLRVKTGARTTLEQAGGRVAEFGLKELLEAVNLFDEFKDIDERFDTISEQLVKRDEKILTVLNDMKRDLVGKTEDVKQEITTGRPMEETKVDIESAFDSKQKEKWAEFTAPDFIKLLEESVVEMRTQGVGVRDMFTVLAQQITVEVPQEIIKALEKESENQELRIITALTRKKTENQNEPNQPPPGG